jgi:predicted alpha/beta hydrolase family esterase
MKKDVLFLQGGGEGAYEFDTKLAESLQSALGAGYKVRYPRMPNEDAPDFQVWNARIAAEIGGLGEDVILVGHSIGATILIGGLAQGEYAAKIAAVFLVAPPFVGEGGWPSEDIEPMDQLGVKLPRKVPVYLYHGGDDDTVPAAHMELYTKAIPRAKLRRLDRADHQLNNDLSEIAADIRRLGETAGGRKQN